MDIPEVLPSDSEVDLSRTVSRDEAGTRTSRVRAAAIQDLPADLIKIFNIIFFSLRGIHRDDFIVVGCPDYELHGWPSGPLPRLSVSEPEVGWEIRCTCWEEPDPNSQTLFPDALSVVSASWKYTLSLVSACWTRLIIFVDDDPTPLSTISERLALSGTRLLEITITRRGTIEADPSEEARVAAAMGVPIPHMPRWKSFRLDVLHYSSIPIPLLNLRGNAKCLCILRLQSRLHDAPASAHFTPTVATRLQADIPDSTPMIST